MGPDFPLHFSFTLDAESPLALLARVASHAPHRLTSLSQTNNNNKMQNYLRGAHLVPNLVWSISSTFIDRDHLVHGSLTIWIIQGIWGTSCPPHISLNRWDSLQANIIILKIVLCWTVHIINMLAHMVHLYATHMGSLVHMAHLVHLVHMAHTVHLSTWLTWFTWLTQFICPHGSHNSLVHWFTWFTWLTRFTCPHGSHGSHGSLVHMAHMHGSLVHMAHLSSYML